MRTPPQLTERIAYPAMKKGGFFDRAVVGVAFYLQSISYFFVVMLLLVGHAYYLKWFPISHARTSGLGDAGGLRTALDVMYPPGAAMPVAGRGRVRRVPGRHALERPASSRIRACKASTRHFTPSL